MPKYDYRCTNCGRVYEKREGFDAPAVQSCPQCSGTARRVLTPPAIVFKGSGWYVNDSRKGTPDGESSSTSTKSDAPASNGEKSSTSTGGSGAGTDSSGSSTKT